MMEWIALIIGSVYLLIGLFMDSVVKEEWQQPSIVSILFWPLVLIMLIVLGILTGVMNLGEWVRKKIFH
ncbi:MAG: hypothetical protein ACLSBC_01340 [[Clostridium] scindens]